MPEHPLTSDEEKAWRALLRIVVTLPPLLNEDLVRATGVSLTEYATLMNLSEAPDQEMRLTDLANAIGLSLSRVSRVIDDLRSRGLVTKRRASSDTRGSIAALTAAGLQRLEKAYPDHLASARNRVMNHIDPRSLASVVEALTAVAERMTAAAGQTESAKIEA